MNRTRQLRLAQTRSGRLWLWWAVAHDVRKLYAAARREMRR